MAKEASSEKQGMLMIKDKKHYFSETNPLLISQVKKQPPAVALHRQKSEEASLATCGSVTVEATFALSFFLLFFAALLSIFGVLQRQIESTYSLDAVAEKVAVVAGVKSGEEMDISISVLGNGISISGDDVVIEKTGIERIAFLPESTTTFITSQRVVRRAWTGRILKDEDESDDEDEYVYVAENGTVYHTTESCTHLKLSISATDSDSVGELRNSDGAKYHPCEKCGGGSGTIYITPEGDRYHADKECSGLKRTYTKVKKSECSLPACSRCGGK